jgi:hypothetical protein
MFEQNTKFEKVFRTKYNTDRDTTRAAQAFWRMRSDPYGTIWSAQLGIELFLSYKLNNPYETRVNYMWLDVTSPWHSIRSFQH